LTGTARISIFASFQVRSFRFQWPADLATSWALEMESLILGWYILVETGSVLLFTVFASLGYMGNLLAPVFGVMAHRIGTRRLLACMRATYAILATSLMAAAFMGVVTPGYVFVVAGLMGLVKPSDLVMRYALIGETMPPTHLLSAASTSRTTQDSARIAGALTGAGMVAWLGMGPAYLAIAGLYTLSFFLTLQVGAPCTKSIPTPATPEPSRPSPWRDLQDAFAYMWRTPQLRAAMYMAFLFNVTAFPLVNSLMPYVAKEVHGTDQTGLGYLLSAFAFGALLGSLLLNRFGSHVRSGRNMLVFLAVWYGTVMVFAQMEGLWAAIFVLVLVGCAQSLCTVPMSAMLLRTSAEHMRGRVMGIRMLAVYGVPIGLLISGPLLASHGFQTTAMLYCAVGLAFTLVIAVRWRAHLWNLDAAANRR
jgi:MFS family permease